MNHVSHASSSIRMGAVVLLTLFALAWAGTAIPAQAQTYTDLHDFNASAGDPYNFQITKLAQGRDGNFYGESNSGGTGNGTVAKMTPGGTVSIVLSFDGTDGANALGGLTLGTDGNLYGDTWGGGSGGLGITFKVTPAGVETALHNFSNTGDGSTPANALVLATNGTFYGTSNTVETIYSISSSGTFKTLHTLSTTDGQNGGQLSLGSTGDIFGGMNGGGANGQGTLFKMTPAGVFTVLHNFTGTDGSFAAPGMVEAPNGVLYGATEFGGASNAGVVFKITTSGTYTLLHSLNGTTDGKQAFVLMLATDGNMYGLTQDGGSDGCGVIFKVTQAGVYSVIYNFDNTHGCNPSVYLTQGTDGKLYGLTQAGGANSNGVFYSLDLDIPAFVTLQSTSGKVGTKVGILGMGFSSSSVVKFNGVTATSTLTDPGYITATVPAGATDGYVTVTTGSTTLTSTQKYIVHNSWASGAAMPTPVAAAATGLISGKIYVAGGFAVNGGAPVDNNQVYNPTTNAWTTAAAIPTPVDGPASAVLKGLLYVIGGYEGTSGTPSNLVQIYNPTKNAWTTGTAMPTARGSVAAVVDGTSIYVIGGNGSTLRLTTVEKYVPSTNAWTEEAPLLTGVSEPSAGLLGSTIVTADGFTTTGDLGTTEGYDVSTNAWSGLTSDPNARNASCFGVVSGLLYVAGGLYSTPSTTEPLTVNESFNVKTDKWTTLAPMPTASFWQGVAVDGDLLYCIGGQASYQGSVIGNVQIYQP
jgi:uncharacterized repeat protein (TIGR03803 family)